MKPLFIPCDQGALFCVYHPCVGKSLDQAILYVPPFAEEMNKARCMAALQARAFADRGYAVLMPDLFGTGDSVGDFGDATWEIWLQHIDSAIAWLKLQGAKTIALWGLRTGALLAMDFASRGHGEIDSLLCWQPVLNGDTFVTQFLRLRVAAAMMDNDAPREKTSDLKRKLQDGQGIEVAGYWLNPELIKPLMALRADQLSLPTLKKLAIFEVVANEDMQESIANAQFLGKMQGKAMDASLAKVVGDAFWATQEIAMAPDLIKLTCETVANVGTRG